MIGLFNVVEPTFRIKRVLLIAGGSGGGGSGGGGGGHAEAVDPTGMGNGHIGGGNFCSGLSFDFRISMQCFIFVSSICFDRSKPQI